MAFVLTFLLIAGLEIAVADNNVPVEPVLEETPETPETPEDSDMCVGCDEPEEEEGSTPQLTVEVRVDPVTGEVLYVIKGLVIE